MKIKQKLILLFLLISMIPISIISIFAYVSIQNEIIKNTTAQLVTTSANQEQRLDTVLEKYHEGIIALANSFNVKDTLLNEPSLPQATNSAVINKLFQDTQNKYPTMLSLSLINASGSTVASTNANEIGTKLTSPDYLFLIKNADNFVIAKDKYDQTDKLYFASTVFSEGKKIGFVLGTFLTDDIIAIINDYTNLGETGETLLTKYDANKALSLTPLRFAQGATLNTDLKFLHAANNNDTLYTNIIDYRNHNVLVVTKHLNSVPWIMATKIDTDEVFKPVILLRNALAIVFLLSSFFIILAALYFARIFTAPIIAITEKANKISLGDFKQKIEIKSSDELGILASEFNNMASQLAQSYSELEQKVKERTGQLSEKVDALEKAKKAMANVMGALQIDKMKIDEQKNVLKSILDNLPVGVSLSLAPSGRIVNINKIGTELLGKTVDINEIKENMINVNSMMRVDDTPYPPNENPLTIALKEGRANMKDDLYVQNAEGIKICIRATCVPIKNINGEMISVVSVFEDVTKEKQVDRMKTEFISLASHQLRTPLSAIKWFSEMLVGGDAGKLTDEQQDFVQNISDSTQRMIELVNSLLNISRIESGRILIDPKPTDLKELVHGVVTDLKAKIEGRKQNLVISVRDDLPKINLDPRLIRQVYMNLLTNAIKYTPKEGEITVFISKKDDQIISQVSDNGYGIPKAQQDKVFQKFFRAENIIKVETDGTGLGLYLIKAIIESSQGNIWFSSEEGKGTSFWFSLPLSGMIAKKGEVTLDE